MRRSISAFRSRLASNSACRTPATYAAATKKSASIRIPGTVPTAPQVPSAPSTRSPYRSATISVAHPPIEKPKAYVHRGRPCFVTKKSQSAAVSSAARPGIRVVLLKLDAAQA
jgi:hypothetical protein